MALQAYDYPSFVVGSEQPFRRFGKAFMCKDDEVIRGLEPGSKPHTRDQAPIDQFSI